jgi:Tol biopolymer transport system component
VNATWSPDGKSIAFDDYHQISVIGADGKGLHYLIQNGTYPAWSPDGSTIAY